MTAKRKIRVLVAKPGLDGHDRGAKVVARGLRDAGMEVIYTGLRQTPEMIAEAALQEDVDVVGLSVLSGAHMVLLPTIVARLREADMAHVLVLAGGIIPDEDISALQAAGIQAIFPPGTPLQEIVNFIEANVPQVSDHDEGLVEQVLAGSKRAVARLITRIENDDPQVQATLSWLYPHTGQAHLIGVTGAPGTGKSSLVNVLASYFRGQAKRVAIVAVDPTSPFTGGAILGDRIRMQSLSGDPGVFIRSMASRGSLGGLARAVSDAVKVLDAAGFEIILIETVGAGQGEVEIARTAQTIIVVEAPGLGDDIQAIKAGILEIADIFVVNKADRDGANRTVASLKAMLELGHPTSRRLAHHGLFMAVAAPAEIAPPSGWEIPVLKTVAIKDEGIVEVGLALDRHRRHLTETGELAERERARLSDELTRLLQLELTRRLLKQIPADELSELMAKLVNRTLAPYNAMELILEDYGL